MEHKFELSLIHNLVPEEQRLLMYDGYTYAWYTRDSVGQPWYFSMVDDEAVDTRGYKCDVYVGAALKEEDLTALLTGNLPIRDALTVKALSVVLLMFNYSNISSYFPISKSRLIEDWLPAKGVCLSCKGVENA